MASKPEHRLDVGTGGPDALAGMSLERHRPFEPLGRLVTDLLGE